MLTYTNYRSFAEVVAHYDSITPLRGSTNAGKDIRPIGDRRRKYERIVKISDRLAPKGVEVYAKAEFMNPCSSVKDR